MTARGVCYDCGRSLNLVSADAVVRHRESLGFGAANDRLRSFCSTQCRARWRGSDAVLDATDQTTLAAYDGTACDQADAIVYGV